MKNCTDQFSLKGKTILLTGAAGILGSRFAPALHDAGANVVLADLRIKDCAHLAKKIAKNSGRLLPLALDITSEESVRTALVAILKKYGRLDGLVNNAVMRTLNEPFVTRSTEAFRRATEVNVVGTMIISRESAQVMKKQKSGVIVNIGSIYGLVGNDQSLYKTEANYDYYSFHKGGVLNFTRYLACLLGRHGIRVNALSPGGILWEQKNGGAAADKDFQKKYGARTPLGRLAHPDEMNGALIFLLSDASKYMTGHNLVVDGGFTAW